MHLNKDGTSNASKIKAINSFGKGNDDMEALVWVQGSGAVQGSQEFHDHLPSVYLLMAQQAPASAVVSSFALFLFIDLFLLAGYSASVHY